MKPRLAREIAVSSLYQMEMNEVSASEAVDMVMEEAKADNEIGLEVGELAAVDAYSRELVEAVHARKEELDRELGAFLTGWQVDRLSRVDRQILRLAAYEMAYRNVPPKVVVSEAIELAKHFGLDESGKFVNGVLGRMIRDQAAAAEPATAEPAADRNKEGERSE